jgi:hypothetical protein
MLGFAMQLEIFECVRLFGALLRWRIILRRDHPKTVRFQDPAAEFALPADTSGLAR